MARNIEFEGKSSITGEWITGNLVFANSAYEHFELEYYNSAYIEQKDPFGRIIRHPIIPETVGQYTNVIGCNRKKIYEHNIVSNGISEGEVYWDYCYNGWQVAVVNDKYNLYGVDLDNSYSVVGHKYDKLIAQCKQ